MSHGHKLPLSVYLLTLNEEANIRAALESVRWADDIVVVDSFSTDGTERICREYTDRFYQCEFAGFGDLRNHAITLARHDWVLSVDADERVTDELRREIEAVMKEGPKADAYFIPRKSHFLDIWIRYGGWYPDYRQPQFFHRNRMRYRDDLVHEGVTFVNRSEGRLGYLNGHVLQYPFRTMSQFLRKMNRYSSLRAEDMHRANRRFRPLELFIRPLFTFLKMLLLRRGFLDGMAGWILAGLYATYVFVKYAKLWELHKSRGSEVGEFEVRGSRLEVGRTNTKVSREKISAVIVVQNEERNIRACLEHVKWVDEIIVVDAFSQDRTAQICEEYPVTLFHRSWTGFGAQKNFGIAQATMPWILLVDADERIPLSLRAEIETTISNGVHNDIAGFMIPRRNYFYGRCIRRLGCSPDHQLRLFKRGRAYLDDAEPHNRMVLDGEYRYLDTPLDHYTVPDVSAHYHKLDNFTTLAARERAKTKSTVSVGDVVFRPIWTCAKLLIARGGFREGIAGLVFCGFAGCYTFLKYAKLWELGRVKPAPRGAQESPRCGPSPSPAA